jgi:hypothetical protein
MWSGIIRLTNGEAKALFNPQSSVKSNDRSEFRICGGYLTQSCDLENTCSGALDIQDEGFEIFKSGLFYISKERFLVQVKNWDYVLSVWGQPQIADFLYCCAGGNHAESGFIPDISPGQLDSCMKNNYYACVYPAKILLNLWIDDDKKGALSKTIPPSAGPKPREIILSTVQRLSWASLVREHILVSPPFVLLASVAVLTTSQL